MKKLITLMAASIVSCGLLAKDYAIVGATVHTMSDKGSLENATVLVRDGKIVNVVTGSDVPEGYQTIDANGKVVTPGLMGAYTSLGLVEVGLSAGTVDSTAKTTSISPSGAALDVAYAVNPDSTLMNISRIEGITAAATGMSRTGQMFKGQGAVITLGDKTSPVIKPRAFIATSVSNAGADAVGGSRANLWVALTTALEEARFANGKALTPTTDWHGTISKADAKALIPVIEGKTPLLIDARRAADIRQVITLKKTFPALDITLLTATEGWRVAEDIAQAKIDVILNPESNLPYGFDELGATLSNAGRLEKAGVKVAIGMTTHNIRLAKQHAGNAVANGLSWEQGLASLTINPARIYGVDNQLGSLEAGKRADLVIWSGDPLQVTESAEQVMIDGQLIPMESRQTKLRDRYLKGNQGKPVQFTR